MLRNRSIRGFPTASDIGRRDHHHQDQSQGIHQHMAFAAFDAFATIKALGTRLRGDLDALAIHTACRGFGGPPLAAAFLVAQGCHYPLPHAGFTPVIEVIIHRIPVAVVARQQPPLTATAIDIENAIHDLAAV